MNQFEKHFFQISAVRTGVRAYMDATPPVPKIQLMQTSVVILGVNFSANEISIPNVLSVAKVWTAVDGNNSYCRTHIRYGHPKKLPC